MIVDSEFDIVQRLLSDKPTFHASGTARWDALPATIEALRRLVRPGDVTFEVGAGVSKVVFAAAGAHHTAASVDPSEHRLIREYCRKIDVDDTHLEFLEGFTDDVLPRHLTRERTLDVAMVDGGHSFPLPIVDWHYVTRALKVGGKLLLDDVPVPAVKPAFQHMSLESCWRLDGIYDNRAAVFTLLREPVPGDDWLHQPFNSGYPDYSFASVPSRMWLRAGYKVQPLRSAVGRRFPALRQFYKSRFTSE
jgi:predicted O-methyltransferase YrrM